MKRLRDKGPRVIALNLVLALSLAITAQTVGIVAPGVQAKPPCTATSEQERLVTSLVNDAVDLMRAKNFKGAEPILQRAAALDVTTKSEKVHTELAYVYLKLDNWKRCASECERALEFEPEAKIGYLVGASYSALGCGDRGVSLIRNHAKTRGQQWQKEAYVAMSLGMEALAISLMKLEKYDQCRSVLESAVGLNDQSAFLHYFLAVVYLETGDPQESIAQAKRATKLDPKVDVSHVLGFAYMCAGEYDQAIEILGACLKKETNQKERNELRDLIQDLNDDKAKVRPGRPSTPDYFDEMKEQRHVVSWPQDRFPLRVYLERADGVKGYRPALKRIFLQSLDEWSEASEGKLAFEVVKKKDDADIVVQWTDKALQYPNGRKGKEAAGITYLERVTKDGISFVRIELETYNNDTQERRSNQSMRSTCLHELGHALGLGHSGYVRDVMFYSSNHKRLLCLSHRDKATIQRYYQEYPTIEHTKLAVRGRDLEVLPDECFAEPTPSLQTRYPETVAMMFYEPASRSSSAGSRVKSLDELFVTPTPPAKPSSKSANPTSRTSKVTDLFATPEQPRSSKPKPGKKIDLFAAPTKPK